LLRAILSRLFQPGLGRLPVYIPEKFLDVISPLQALIEHVGMFENRNIPEVRSPSPAAAPNAQYV